MSENILEVVYDHYKETCALVKEFKSLRDRSYVVLCILETFLFMLIVKPDFFFSLVDIAIKKEFEVTFEFGHNIIQTFLWISIAYVLVRYCQAVLYIEKQYKYLDLLEKKIVKIIHEDKKNNIDNFFRREGAYYLDNYSIILNLIDLFYQMFSPIFFFVINFIRIFQEWQNVFVSFLLICDTIIAVVILIITWFYFFEIHDTLTSFFKKCRIIRFLAEFLRKCLKEV